MLRKWDMLPDEMKTEAVRHYYDILAKKKHSLLLKRLFDIVGSFVLLIILAPLFLILAVAIRVDTLGPVFFRQTRITQYGKPFRIFKFRTMVHDTGGNGLQVTMGDDPRITRLGALLRKTGLDETPQCIDVLRGTMTFVGTRPEVPKYVEHYSEEMMATLLLPAGVTSVASVFFKNECELLEGAEDIDAAYLDVVLPQKMRHNLAAIEQFSFCHELKALLMTVSYMFGKRFHGTGQSRQSEGGAR